MKINQSKQFAKDVKKLEKNNQQKELNRLKQLMNFLILSDNLKEAKLNPVWNVYGFEQLKGDRKTEFSAQVNGRLRLIFKPIDTVYPYDKYEDIIELSLEEISDRYK